VVRKAATVFKKRASKKMARQKLASYRAKRDFERTSEPSGARAMAPAPRLRYVMQKHAARRLHYDLRLELDGVFRSWAVTKGPSLDPNQKRLAVEVEDHPLDYGDFEGTIPKGQYGGGTVMLWDRGFWMPMGGVDPRNALKNGELKFTLSGKKLKGEFVLVRMAARGDQWRNWLLIKGRDAYAAGGDTVSANARSIASNRTMEQIAAGVGRRPRPFMLKSANAQPSRRVLK
jgi:bifunctional non-homologous end joining protein LigD